MTSLSLQVFNYNEHPIIRREDGYINLTQMCQANGKMLSDWSRLKSTKAYIQDMASDTGKPISEILEIVKGGDPRMQGAWGHPELALHLAQWISIKFHRWCNAHIFVLMSTGATSLSIDPIEEMRLKLELARLENNKVQAELQLLQTRQYIATALPEPVQQKILGYQVIEKTEYRDRLIYENQVINDGDTITKTALCQRYGFVTKNNAPDYRKLKKHLESIKLPSEAWELKCQIKDTEELRYEYLPELDKLLMDGDRQMWIGE